MGITEKRLRRIREVASRRQFDLTVVLENVHDTHNIGAVMRTCDSVGIPEIFVLHNNKELVKDYVVIGKNSSSGARKWVDVHFYEDTEKCFAEIRSRYDRIYGTILNENAVSLFDLPLSQSTALVFGNEKFGITDECMPHLDGNYVIPQVGMVQSLNISVACAISLYEAFRQRDERSMYDAPSDMERFEKLTENYVQRHGDKFRGRAHEKK